MVASTSTSTSVTFDKYQKEFPSNAHRLAWYLGASLLPFSAVIPEGSPAAEAEDLRTGEQALNAFFTRLFTDMYLRPQDYTMVESPDPCFEDGEWYCGGCQDKFKIPGPYPFIYQGVKRDLCFQGWFRMRNPNSDQLAAMFRMVELHTEGGLTGLS
jgi:hypothetical protein